MSWSNAKLDWVAVLDTIAENETDEAKRGQNKDGWSSYKSYIHSLIIFREMWDLINVNDCEALTIGQLESGMATVTRYDLLRTE